MVKLTKAQLNEFRKILAAQLAKMTGTVRNMSEEALKRAEQDFSVDHMADHGSDNFDQEFTLSRIESDGRTLGEIQAALKRIDEGTFGKCESCGCQIPKARLNAMPHVRRCVPCQEKFERGEV